MDIHDPDLLERLGFVCDCVPVADAIAYSISRQFHVPDFADALEGILISDPNAGETLFTAAQAFNDCIGELTQNMSPSVWNPAGHRAPIPELVASVPSPIWALVRHRFAMAPGSNVCIALLDCDILHREENLNMLEEMIILYSKREAEASKGEVDDALAFLAEWRVTNDFGAFEPPAISPDFVEPAPIPAIPAAMAGKDFALRVATLATGDQEDVIRVRFNIRACSFVVGIYDSLLYHDSSRIRELGGILGQNATSIFDAYMADEALALAQTRRRRKVGGNRARITDATCIEGGGAGDGSDDDNMTGSEQSGEKRASSK